MTLPNITGRVAVYGGWTAVLLGLAVVTGWWADIEGLRSLHLGGGQIRANSALLFAMLGGAILLIPGPGFTGGRRRTWGLLGLSILLAGGTLLEYWIGRGFGIDELVSSAPMAGEEPVRMSDKSAIGFLLITIALFALHTPARSAWRPMFAGLVSSLAGSLAAFSVAGWFLQLPSEFPMEDVGPMPLPAALGQAVLAVSVMALAHARSRLTGDAVVRWLPLGVAIGVVTLSCMLWLGIRLGERRQIRGMIYRAAVNVERLIEAEVQARILTLVRVAKRWEKRGSDLRSDWEFDAGLYLSHYPDMKAVEWADTNLLVQWVTPQSGNEAELGRDLSETFPREIADGHHRDETGVEVGPVMEVEGATVGFLVKVPVIQQEKVAGHVVGVFRIEPLLKSLLTEVTAGFNCTVTAAGREIYASVAQEEDPSLWGREGLIRLPGRTWEMRVWPRADTLQELRSPLGTAAVGGGGILAVLLGLSIHLAQTARQKERDAVAVNRSLAEEVKERRQIQDALRESQQRLQAILDNTSAVIYLKDTEGRFLLINQQYERLFHVKNDDIVGRGDFEVFPKQMAESFRFNDRRVVSEGCPLVIEEIAPHDDGLHTYISVKFPMRDDAGAVSGVCGISTDITERKQAEARLRDNHQALELARDRLQGILEGSPDQIVALDLRYRILSFNKTFRDHFERRFGESIRPGMRLSEVLKSQPDELQRWFDLWLRAIRGEEFAIEEKSEGEGGGVLFLEHRFSPIRSESGVLIGATQVTRDISDRRRADLERNGLLVELANRNDQLIAANKELEAFSYTVSHDLRAPIRHIDGFVKLLERVNGDALDEKGRRYVTLISDAANKMGRLIDDLLDFSRMGRSEMRLGAVSMKELVAEVVRDLEPDTETRTVEWIVGGLPDVRGDSALVRQVWVNLLSNAVKYSCEEN
ncbi:MAG: PAS domain-containing protein, partial [Verrucomicrobiae bacterium]|nr:PAS domain-containing protein [Verrucomicrobiae bacterium]